MCTWKGGWVGTERHIEDQSWMVIATAAMSYPLGLVRFTLEGLYISSEVNSLKTPETVWDFEPSVCVWEDKEASCCWISISSKKLQQPEKRDQTFKDPHKTYLLTFSGFKFAYPCKLPWIQSEEKSNGQQGGLDINACILFYSCNGWGKIKILPSMKMDENSVLKTNLYGKLLVPF